MFGLLNLNSFLRVAALSICTATYLKRYFPAQLKQNVSSKENMSAASRIFYVGAVAGERLSPYVACLCLYHGILKGASIFR